MPDKTKTVAFRLGGETLERAESLAEREGLSIHELGRRALSDRIEGEASLHRLGMAVKNLEGEMRDLRNDLTAFFRTTLVLIGELTPEKAEEMMAYALGNKES